MLRETLSPHMPTILQKLIDMALDGDIQACRILIDRVMPPLRPVEQAVELSLPTDAGLTEQGAAIVSAMAAGQLSPGQGAAMLGGIGVMARIKELDVLEARIAALEAGNVES